MLPLVRYPSSHSPCLMQYCRSNAADCSRWLATYQSSLRNQRCKIQIAQRKLVMIAAVGWVCSWTISHGSETFPQPCKCISAAPGDRIVRVTDCIHKSGITESGFPRGFVASCMRVSLCNSLSPGGPPGGPVTSNMAPAYRAVAYRGSAPRHGLDFQLSRSIATCLKENP